MEQKSPTPKATPGPGAKPAQSSRDDRLKAALKANLARRKAQARARQDGPEGDGNNEKSGPQDPHEQKE